MAEAGHGLARLAFPCDIVRRVGRLADLPGHAHHVLGGAAMSGSGKGRHRRRYRRMQIGLRAHHHAGGERGGIRSVFCMQDEVLVHQVDGIGRGFLALEHPEEITRMGQVRVGRHRLASVPDVLMRADDRRYLRGQPDPLAQIGFDTVVRGVGIERRKRRHGGSKYIHRMRAGD